MDMDIKPWSWLPMAIILGILLWGRLRLPCLPLARVEQVNYAVAALAVAWWGLTLRDAASLVFLVFMVNLLVTPFSYAVGRKPSWLLPLGACLVSLGIWLIQSATGDLGTLRLHFAAGGLVLLLGLFLWWLPFHRASFVSQVMYRKEEP